MTTLYTQTVYQPGVKKQTSTSQKNKALSNTIPTKNLWRDRVLGKGQQFRQNHSQNIFLSNLIYIHVKYRLIKKKSMRIQRQLEPRAVGNIFGTNVL